MSVPAPRLNAGRGVVWGKQSVMKEGSRQASGERGGKNRRLAAAGWAARLREASPHLYPPGSMSSCCAAGMRAAPAAGMSASQGSFQAPEGPHCALASAMAEEVAAAMAASLALGR